MLNDMATSESVETFPMSMSSAAASHANHSVPRVVDDAVAKQTLVSSGLRCCALLTKESRLGSLLRMLLTSEVPFSRKWYLIWKPSAMKSGRLKFRLVPSDTITGGKGSGFLATPTATANQACNSMQKWPGCRGVIVTPEEWERRMGFPVGWTDLQRSVMP